MNNDGAELSKGQVACLAYGSACGNIVYTFTWVTHTTGRAFWVAIALGVILNIPFALWILYLGKSSPKKTIFEILESGLGKFISKFLIIIYIIINFGIVISMLNLFTGTVNVYFLQKTPDWVLVLFLVLICAFFAKKGMLSIGRFVQIMVVLFTLNYFAAFSASFVNAFNLEYITPIFDTTFTQFAKGVLITAGGNAESLLLFMIMLGFTPQSSQHYKSIAKGLLTWSFILSFAVFIMEGVLSHEVLSRIGHAGVSVSRIIQISTFVQGLEILVLMTYQYIAIVKITIVIYSCWAASKLLFNVEKGTILLTLCSIIVIVISSWINSFNTGYFLAEFIGSYIILPFVILVLLLTSLSVKLNKKRSKVSKK